MENPQFYAEGVLFHMYLVSRKRIDWYIDQYFYYMRFIAGEICTLGAKQTEVIYGIYKK